MSKAAFQSGMSWQVIEAKWPGMSEALHGFDPQWAANLTPDDVDALVVDKRLIRNRRKIEATVHNARTMLELDREHGGFRNYLRSRPDFYALVTDMRKRFKFLGEMGAFYFLYVVSEPVPSYEEWRAHQASSGASSRRR
jgi:3-methyladenine DNA glycosylase Tag